ncbi:MAG: hypothetical protein HYW90_01105 [Candidatus Sungbacteria bacterium]|nr:hypothetical protein [Candidatus Sungbacteria bacterium]
MKFLSHSNYILLASALVVVLFALPSIVLAQGLVHCGGTNPDGTIQPACTICDLAVLGIRITKFLITNIAIPLAGLMIVVGGLMIMFGAASESRVTAGKKILTNAIIGVVIVFISWLLVSTIIKVLTGNLDTSSAGKFIGTLAPWNELPSGACRL